ncbi:uncharacterized protein LOC121712893 isoform X2 [Alosa sapidissima]|nr:uncharacterized protein LOC121712893 isoform X2 [Alosa sapidissima]
MSKHRPRSQAQRRRRNDLSQWGQVQKRISTWCGKSRRDFAATPFCLSLWIDTKTGKTNVNFAGPQYLKSFFTDEVIEKLMKHHMENKSIGQGCLEHEAELGACDQEVYVDPFVDSHFLRAALGAVTKQYLKRTVKSVKYLPQNRPAWWPLSIPFVSPNDGKNPKRRELDADALQAVAVSYNTFYGLKPGNDGHEQEEEAGTTSQDKSQ